MICCENIVDVASLKKKKHLQVHVKKIKKIIIILIWYQFIKFLVLFKSCLK